MGIRAELDAFTFFGVSGWAYDPDDLPSPVQIELSLDGKIIASSFASNFRQDLLDAGIGTGHYAFQLLFKDPPSDCDLKRMIVIARNGANAGLHLKPWMPPSPELLARAVSLQAFAALYRPRLPTTFLCSNNKEVFYDGIAAEVGDGTLTYMEFGVHTGWSFAQMLRRFTSADSCFFGFDSFEGLPEKWIEGCGKGHFDTGGSVPAIQDSRANFIKGWFQNTVPSFLSSNRITGQILVHFDADLYSSTLFLLTTLWHHFAEYYFIFDEFYPDEVVAMHDFARSYPVEVEFLSSMSMQVIPTQVFGRLKRIPLRI